MCKVSILMCAYKEPESFVHEAIESILAQTYSDYEFIIVLDAPENEDLMHLIKGYAISDSRVRLYVNDKNIGLTKSLNRGLLHCVGDYIVRIDADDIAFSNRIEKQVMFMDENPNIVASGASAVTIDSEGNQLSILNRKSAPNYLKTLSVFESPIYHPSAIFRRVIDGEPVQYNEDFKYSQDYALWVSMMSKHDVSNIEDCLIKYRISERQISSKSHYEQQECAKKNLIAAVKMLELPIDDDGINILSSFARNPQKEFPLRQIEKFIIELLNSLQAKPNFDYDAFRDHLLLVYYNYVANLYSVKDALVSFVRLSKRQRYVYLYGFLSIINKLRTKKK